MTSSAGSSFSSSRSSNDFIASGTGLMLIDIVSWAAETLSFYIDRQATESYLSTARLRRSVQRLTRQIGYEMRGAVAASTDLEVNLDEVRAFDVPVPEEFQFQGPNGLVFEAVEEVIFPAGEGPDSPPRTISVREGSTRIEVFTSDGTGNQVFRLNPGEGKFVATASDEVRVDGSPWSRSSIITFDQTDQYEISYNADPATVRFGDGVAGNIPPAGAEVRVKYLSTSGRAGMNAISGTIDDVVTGLVIAFQTIGLVVTNPDPTAGGDNQESLEEAKANAPGFFKARNVAVTREDYVSLSQAFNDPIAGQVAVAQAFVALGADQDLTLQILLNNIRNITEPLSTLVQASTGTASLALDEAETQRLSIDSQITNDIQPALDSIMTDPLLATVSGDAETIRATARSVRSEVSDADVLADNGLADGTLVGKDARFNDIKALLSGMSSDLSSIVSSVGSIESSVDEANTSIITVQGVTRVHPRGADHGPGEPHPGQHARVGSVRDRDRDGASGHLRPCRLLPRGRLSGQPHRGTHPRARWRRVPTGPVGGPDSEPRILPGGPQGGDPGGRRGLRRPVPRRCNDPRHHRSH